MGIIIVLSCIFIYLIGFFNGFGIARRLERDKKKKEEWLKKNVWKDSPQP